MSGRQRRCFASTEMSLGEQRKLLEAYLRCGRNESRIVMVRYQFFRPGLFRNVATALEL
jgi:hypothetical protein